MNVRLFLLMHQLSTHHTHSVKVVTGTEAKLIAPKIVHKLMSSEYKLYYCCESDFCPQDEIEQVILVGGSTRVPKVQEVLLKAVGK